MWLLGTWTLRVCLYHSENQPLRHGLHPQSLQPRFCLRTYVKKVCQGRIPNCATSFTALTIPIVIQSCTRIIAALPKLAQKLLSQTKAPVCCVETLPCQAWDTLRRIRGHQRPRCHRPQRRVPAQRGSREGLRLRRVLLQKNMRGESANRS